MPITESSILYLLLGNEIEVPNPTTRNEGICRKGDAMHIYIGTQQIMHKVLQLLAGVYIHTLKVIHVCCKLLAGVMLYFESSTYMLILNCSQV